MKNTKKMIMLITILPWLSIPFLGVKSIKRFFPGAIFMCFFLIAEGRLAEKKKWWWFPFTLKPNVLGELPLIIGPFFVGSLWILKHTFGKFNLYLIVNMIVDSVFTYFGTNLLKKIGYASLIRLTKIQLSITFLVKSFLMYGFQMFYEKYLAKSLPPKH